MPLEIPSEESTGAADSATAKLRAIKRRRRRAALLRRLVVAVLLAGGVGAYFYFSRTETPPDPAPVLAEAEKEAVPELAEAPKTAEAMDVGARVELPSLDVSDPLVRELFSRAFSQPELTSWLASPDLLRRFTAAVANVSDGDSPREHLSDLTPKAPFRAAERDERLYVDPKAYRRYDLIADLFASFDTRICMELYATVRPLIDEAYADLGYADQSFEEALARAILELLGTPVVEGDVELTPRVISYAYGDPQLEGLSSAQKQLLRMGPRSVRKVQGKLREFAAALGIPAG